VKNNVLRKVGFIHMQKPPKHQVPTGESKKEPVPMMRLFLVGHPWFTSITFEENANRKVGFIHMQGGLPWYQCKVCLTQGTVTHHVVIWVHNSPP
jgi:hypothetical protein